MPVGIASTRFGNPRAGVSGPVLTTTRHTRLGRVRDYSRFAFHTALAGCVRRFYNTPEPACNRWQAMFPHGLRGIDRDSRCIANREARRSRRFQ